MNKAAMDKVTLQDGESANLVNENIEQLKAIFPEVFGEGGVDFDTLRQLLGDARIIDESEERYGIAWHGKKKARQVALTPSTGTLLPCPEESVDWDTTNNLFIESDNLEALKLLRKSYAGKIKLIYIDPPYNTGKEFIYPDRFQDNLDAYLKYTGQINEVGEKVSSETETAGRMHTNWLNMMYPRLKLAKGFLKKDGAICISIDEHEHVNLIAICNEIFGEENYVASISVVNNLKGRNDRKNVATCHEYMVIYGNPDFLSYGIPLTHDQLSEYKYSDESGNLYALRDLRKRGGADKRTDRPKLFFPIYYNQSTKVCTLERKSPDDVKIIPTLGDGTEGCWRWGTAKVSDNLSYLHPKYNKSKDRWGVEHRVYLNPSVLDDSDEEDDDEDLGFERTSKSKSFWWGADVSTDYAGRVFKDLFDGMPTDYPKSPKLIQRILQMCTRDGDIVLDFFGGFCTTAHAVMEINAEENTSRKYIMVQLPEPCNEKSEALKAGYTNIAEVGKERIRRAAKKLKEQRPDHSGDLGFKVFKLAGSNIKAWCPDRFDLEASLFSHEEHLIEGRTEMDILYELLLKRGIELTSSIESREVLGKKIYSIGYGVVFACLNEKISKGESEDIAQEIIKWHSELSPASEAHVFFRDSAFGDDIVKTNMAAILEQNGITHVRSL